MDLVYLERLGDALHWLHATRVQAERFLTGFADQGLRRTTRIRPDDWRASMYSADAHLLLVAVRQLVRALDRVPADAAVPQLSEDVAQAAVLLRNILEHWDEQRSAFSNAGAPKTKSGKTFASTFPDYSPWSFSWSNTPEQGTRIGGAFHVERLLEDLVRIEAALVPIWEAALREVGVLPYRGPAVEFNPPIDARDSPGEVALAAFAEKARLVATRIEGDSAVVLVLADVDPDAGIDGCPWWVVCSRRESGWRFAGGGNGSGGWHRADEATGRGVLYSGGQSDAASVSVTFRGVEEQVLVEGGFFVWACFDASPDEWPTIVHDNDQST